MTIILRLQGLDVKASTEDIRTFFKSLHIPEGGVYIVGGSLREAFIAFTSERDAQLAMRYTGNSLKGSEVTLHLSSMEELEHKLKTLLKRKRSSPTQLNVEGPQPSSDANLQPLSALPHTCKAANLPPITLGTCDSDTASLLQPFHTNSSNLHVSNALDPNTAFLLGICTVLQGLQSSEQRENIEALPRADISTTSSPAMPNNANTPEQTLDSKPGYVRLFGLPASATKEVICKFFSGLMVQEVIVNVKLGRGHGCLVKFARAQDASDALLFNQQSLGSVCVEVRGATEKMWTSALQECETALNVTERVKPKQSCLEETENQRPNSSFALKRRSGNQLPSIPPKLPRHQGMISPAMEYTVMVRNLPKTMTKTEIKELFGCPDIAHKNVLHLLDKEGNRTDTAFLIFNRIEDHDYAVNLTGCRVGSDAIEVSSITRKTMRDMMVKNHPRNLETGIKKTPNQTRKCLPVETPEEAQSMKPAAQKCLYIRNMPADVKKSQIKILFSNYKLKNNDIFLLLDIYGKGIGEAVVQFKSQKLAALAQSLHGQDFLGANVLLTRINVKQMEDILARNVLKN